MAPTEGSTGELGRPAPDFTLPGVDGRMWTLNEARGPNGLINLGFCDGVEIETLLLDLAHLHPDVREEGVAHTFTLFP